MKRVLLILIAVLFTTGVAFAEPADAAKALSVRTFQFKYKSADRAAAVIKSLLSAEGTMSIQPKANSLVVTDHADNIKAVAGAIADYDAAPRAVKLSVRLIGAARGEAAGPRSPDELKDLSKTFTMMGYTSVDALGSVNIESHEGETGSVNLADGYRADFKFGEYDPASNSVELTDFRISKLQNDQLIEIYKTTLNLTVGQNILLGVKRPKGQRALFVDFVVRR